MKNICVFSSSNKPFDNLLRETELFCSQFGKNGWSLLWGASQVGLMGIIADSVRLGGGRLNGVSVERLVGMVRKDIDDLYVAKTLSERVDTLISRADYIVVMPGGSGTFDEMAHAIELKRLGYHQKPIVLFNIDGFFDHFLRFSDHVANLGMQTAFVNGERKKANVRDFIHVCNDAQSTIELFSSFE